MQKRTAGRIGMILLCVLLGLVLALYIPQLIIPVRNDVAKLEQWTDQDGHDIVLPSGIRSDVPGTLALTTTLPEQLDSDRALCFWSYYSTVRVMVDDSTVYLHNNAGHGSFGEAASSSWHMVPLPKDAGGKVVTLQMTTPYTDINFRLNEVMIGTMPALHNWLHTRYAINTTLNSIMVWTGILFIVLALVQPLKRRYRHFAFCAGWFFLVFSVFLRTGQKNMPMDWISSFTQDFFSYLSIYALPIPLALYTRGKVENFPKQVRWCNILAVTSCVLLVVAFLLHALGIADIHTLLPAVYLLLCVVLIIALCYSITAFCRRRTLWTALAMVSPLAIFLTLILEYVQFYFAGGMSFDTSLICYIGAVVVMLSETALFLRNLRMERAKQERIAEENRNLQIQMLTDRIRPHFVLNTVGAIRSLIPRDPKRASDLLYDFSKYMRTKLEQKDFFRPIPFQEELEHIRIYLKLEQARFGDTVEINYDIRDSAFYVLPLTIQPFVENAIKHGLFHNEGGGVLNISCYEEGDGHVVEIVDNGVGFDAENLSALLENKSSVGLRSALMRLENEMQATVSIRSHVGSNKGTQVRIVIPESR